MTDIADVIRAVQFEALKLLNSRRDKREPDRGKKETAQDKLASALARRFRKQRARVMELARREAPNRKVLTALDLDLLFGDDPDADEILAEMITIISRYGIEYFIRRVGLSLNYGLVNDKANTWARTYTYDLIRKINDYTREVVRSVLTEFINTPGMTIGDFAEYLTGKDLFSADRAMRIAVTETTRAYAEGQRIAGEEMKKEFPDVRVTKTWFTNVDDIVCDICAPLEGREVELDEPFDEGIDNPPAHVNCRCWTDVRTRVENAE